ncbi:AI-2E family transporter [Flavobacteriaceae bacterium XHP0103]|uniref:AI-2E family transporter n=1 Tax=Marixanthotalea marina TaxID=2844359 RepID=UPI002989CFB1|nr:AI-2E family transporter [Marixanthotalea marina]MBU3821808.1 AI-2E family transporter [Marixanthotalea marina]
MNTIPSIQKTALGLISFIAIVFILYILKPLIIPVLYAIILAVMVFPVQNFLEKKWRFGRLCATLCSLSIIFLITAILLTLIYLQLNSISNSGEDYSQKISNLYYSMIESVQNAFNMNNSNSLFSRDLDIGSILKGNFDKIGSFLTQSGALISNLVLVPIYLFFFLYYRRFFRAFYYKLFRNKSKSFLNKMINKVYNIQQNYLLGLIKVIFIVGVLNTTGLLILGIEHAIFFGFFAAILLLIPYVGVIIGSLIPAVVALATKDSYWYAIGVIAIFMFIQFLEGNFITPKITGSKVRINAFVAIISLIIFSMLWGIAGMIVALPITATLKIIFDNTPGYQAYGFLIGEPVDKHLQSKARNRLKKWKEIRNNK